jgi:thiol-disulfide isomerase/thioredoxin
LKRTVWICPNFAGNFNTLKIQIMTKQFLATLSLILTLSTFTFAQQQNRVINDSRLHRDVLVGLCNDDGLRGSLFGSYFNNQYVQYHPDTAKIEVLKKKLSNVQITIVFGSWCGDSKMQMGRFYKILDRAGFDYAKVRVIAVDRSLKAGDISIASLKIKRIPTFILFSNGNEIGRIVESPEVSLEGDLVNILNK